MPKGRPSKYSPALAAEICRRLADGESLRAICRDDGMPCAPTVCGWALNEPFAEQYTRARQTGYLLMADELLEIADETGRDTIIDENGEERTNHEWITRSRLRVDTRKWLLSKMLPKIYGDRIEADHRLVDSAGQPVDVLTAAQRIAFLLAMGVQQAEEKSPPLH